MPGQSCRLNAVLARQGVSDVQTRFDLLQSLWVQFNRVEIAGQLRRRFLQLNLRRCDEIATFLNLGTESFINQDTDGGSKSVTEVCALLGNPVNRFHDPGRMT